MGKSKRKSAPPTVGRARRAAATVARPFPIVGVGASAGGLEAVKQLLAHLGPKPGLAIVYVQHLDPTHVSFLIPLLAASTTLRVLEATEGVAVEADHVYVIPPHANASMTEGALHVSRRGAGHEAPRAIDAFFESLAGDQGRRAVAVILSGNGSDGSLGVKAIHAAGGVAFAQDPSTAKFDGMPRSAAASGAVGFVLPPERIAAELRRLARGRPASASPAIAAASAPLPRNGDPLARILNVVWSAVGVDLHGYKRPMIRRRVLRRMAIHRAKSLEAYADLLQGSPGAVAELFSDLLITVTEFFRDPEVFRALKARVLPAILKQCAPGAPIRVWVPGCSTGEEAYSIAICLLEVLHGRADRRAIQVFGTDIGDDAIAKARAGVYTERALRGVSPRRLREYFRPVEGGHQVHKRVRDLCVFARQNLVRDPPFSKMDLVSCRNLLIYLQPALQQRATRALHYALNPGGFLVLGTAESPGATDLFAPSGDKRLRIFTRRAGPADRRLDLSAGEARPLGAEPRARLAATAPWEGLGDAEVAREADRQVLGRFAPPGAVVDERLEVIQFRGETAPYLAHRAGEASLHLFKLAHEDIALELRAAVAEARRDDAPAVRAGLRVPGSGGRREASIEVVPLHVASSAKPHLLVLFHETAPREGAAAGAEACPLPARRGARKDERRAGELARDLRTAKERLRSVTVEYEAASEELAELNADFQNLLASVQIPVLVLGRGLTIRRFTAPAEGLFNLIASDVGRPIGDLRSNIDVPELDALLRRVIESARAEECEVRDRGGRRYALWARPYLTREGKVDGAVLTFFDVTEARRAREALDGNVRRLEILREIDAGVLSGGAPDDVARSVLARFLRMVPAAAAGVLIIDEAGAQASRIVATAEGEPPAADVLPSPLPLARFGGAYPLESTENLLFDDLEQVRDRPPILTELLAAGVRCRMSVPLLAGGRVIGRLFANAREPRALKPEHVDFARAVADHLAVAVTQTRLNAEVRAARARLEGMALRLVDAQEAERRRIATELHDELGQRITGLRLSIQVGAAGTDVSKLQEALTQVDGIADAVRKLSQDLRPSVLDDLGLLPAIQSHIETFTAHAGICVRLEQEGLERRFPPAVETAAYRVVQEGLTNVARHAGVKEATVRLWGADERLEVQVDDRGAGFDPAAALKPGHSSGLAGITERVALLGGEVDIDAAPGRGTRLHVTLPVAAGDAQGAAAAADGLSRRASP